MTLEVKVRPGCKEDRFFRIGSAYNLNIKAKAVDGEANKAAVKLLAKLFKVRQQDIVLIKGKTSRLKVFDISGLAEEKLEGILGNVTGENR